MKKVIAIALLFCLVFSFQSCMTAKVDVGGYNDRTDSAMTYSNGRQFWLFWGLIPLGHANVNTPNDGRCQVVMTHSLGDVIISALTGGIVMSEKVKIKVAKPVSGR